VFVEQSMTFTIDKVKWHIGGIVHVAKQDLLKDDVVKALR
jgi:hypothetical protein